MTVHQYFSTDASAPVLDGTAGSALNVLDACLVSGYGARAAAGWSSPFTGTNKRVYRAASPGGSPGEGTQFYLRVDDSGTVTATGRGYESMTDVDTGSEPFPTVAQVTAGVVLRKSSTADAVARPWGLIADQKFFIFISMTNSVAVGDAATADCSFLFGDFRSYLTGDLYRALIVGSTTSGTSQGSFLRSEALNTFTATAGYYLARNYAGAAGAVGFAPTSKRSAVSARSGAGMLYASSPMGGSLTLERAYIYETTGSNIRMVCRGYIESVWHISNIISGTPLRTFDQIQVSAGPLIGRILMFVRTSTDGFFIEISDSW